MSEKAEVGYAKFMASYSPVDSPFFKNAEAYQKAFNLLKEQIFEEGFKTAFDIQQVQIDALEKHEFHRMNLMNKMDALESLNDKYYTALQNIKKLTDDTSRLDHLMLREPVIRVLDKALDGQLDIPKGSL